MPRVSQRTRPRRAGRAAAGGALLAAAGRPPPSAWRGALGLAADFGASPFFAFRVVCFGRITVGGLALRGGPPRTGGLGLAVLWRGLAARGCRAPAD